jgi:hypothetical protein
VSFTIKSQVGTRRRPKVESDFGITMNKTPIIIVIVAILVVCCCSTCALGCTLYFFSKAGDLSQHEEWVSNVNPKASKNGYADGYGCGSVCRYGYESIYDYAADCGSVSSCESTSGYRDADSYRDADNYYGASGYAGVGGCNRENACNYEESEATQIQSAFSQRSE